MNCLSFFDGMSCGMFAAIESELEIDQYFACEIDPYATKVSRHNFPDIIRLGNVKDIHYLNTGLCTQRTSGSWIDIPNSFIDLFIGGSPCQDLRPGKDGLKGKKSILFYEYSRMLQQIRKQNPEVKFVFENVTKISNDDKKIISDILGVKPIRLNANLVSAQNRDRYYWTNIVVTEFPKNLNINLLDILEVEVDEKYYLSEKAIRYINKEERITKKYTAINNQKALTLQARYEALNGTFLCVDCNGRVDEYKSNTLTMRYSKGVENFGGNPFLYNGKRYRKFTPKECERLQSLPDGVTSCVSDTQAYKMLGNGWNIKIIAHILKFYKR